MPRQSARQRALVAIGDRTKIASGELITALLPDWRDKFNNSMQKAGYWLSKALDARPRRELTEYGFRSFYYRNDLEGVTRVLPPVPAPTPTTTAEWGSDEWLAARGIARCRHCGLNTPADNDLCLRCHKPL
jgi:hypothetical protein